MATETTTTSRDAVAEAAAAWQWLRAGWGGGAAPPVVALIGLGRGAVLDAILRFAPATKILALEPDVEHVKAIATHPLWQSWRASGQLVYLAGPDYLGADQAWRVFPTEFQAPSLVVHPTVALGPTVAVAADVLKKILVGAEANWQARQKFAPRYLTNSLRNLPAIVGGCSVERLRDAFAGVPAIIVGAGPSLDRAYDELRAAVGCALIIATDTSLRPLLANGIVPQLVVGLDPSEANARHFFSLPECEDTWLVAESALDPRAAAVFAERTLWWRASEHQPWPWLRALGAEDGQLEVWGSVLTGAFQTAVLGGCDPIIAVGADFAYTGDQPYARGTTWEFDWAFASAFGTSVGETWRMQMARRDVITAPDVHGNPTQTTSILLAFRDWMQAQGRQGKRRLINASDAGTLCGKGIAQARLLDVLGPRVELPAIAGLAEKRSAIRPAAIAREVRAVAARAKAGRRTEAPLAEWNEFVGGNLDSAAVTSALEASATTLETKRGRPVVPFGIPWDLVADATSADVLSRLPELTTHVRAVLRGEPVSRIANTGATDVLVRTLELLRTIADTTLRGPDLVSWPDPAVVRDLPAAGTGMWPDTARWAVSVFEALLGTVWSGPSPRPPVAAFAEGAVAVRQSVDPPTRRNSERRPFATHACVLLALEWLRCVASLEQERDGNIDDCVTRLCSLEEILRTWPVPDPAGPQAELIIEAGGPLSATVLRLPLGIGEEVLARMLTGAVREATDLWELARIAVGGLSVRVGIQRESTRPTATPPAGRVFAWPTTGIRAVRPRVLTTAEWPAAVIAGQAGADVLCVTPFAPTTARITSNGEIVPHGSWPKPLTGALSLGRAGDIAWSNVWGKRPDGPRPYLMYRASPDAAIEVIPLKFRPSAGVWWNGRVYWNCQPTPDAKGGIGSWAPGEDVRVDFPELTLFPLVPEGDVLGFDPLVVDANDAVVRRPSKEGWTWKPGSAPVPRTLGPLGQTSSATVLGEWTVYAHPHADLIRLVSSDERELTLRCYYPLRIASAGDTLVVMNGERQILAFDGLLRKVNV